MRKRIYLAGPEVFHPDAAALGARKTALCARHGFEGLFPLDNAVPGGAEPLDRRIWCANRAMMQRADLTIANLTPFRGPSADAGTVLELGLMAGLGKPVLGYTNVAGDLAGRVAQSCPGVARDAYGVLRDADGLAVEEFGNADNLMIDQCLIAAGHPIVRRAVGAGALFTDLTGFEACLRLAAALG